MRLMNSEYWYFIIQSICDHMVCCDFCFNFVSPVLQFDVKLHNSKTGFEVLIDFFNAQSNSNFTAFVLLF